MARENINVGAAANDGTGDTVRAAFIKTNNNFTELYAGNFLAAGTAALPSLSFATDTNTGLFSPAADTWAVATGGVERLRVSSAGKVGVGTVVANSQLHVQGLVGVAPPALGAPPVDFAVGPSTAYGMMFGTISDGSGYIQQSRWDGAAVAYPLRLQPMLGNVGIGSVVPVKALHVSSVDQSAARIRVQNTASGGGTFDLVAGVDSLTQAGWSVFDATTALTRLKISPAGAVSPGADNTQILGEASWRWSEIFCVNPIINTSDAREKTWRGTLTEVELRAASRIAREVGVFRWNDGKRLHVGLRAQAVWAIMADEGLVDPIGKGGKPGKTPYAFLCYDAWEEQRGPVYEEENLPEVLDDEGNVISPARTEQRDTGETRVTLEAGDRFGLRLEQLSFFISAAQEQRLMALEAKL
jgi:hypothetical protein